MKCARCEGVEFDREVDLSGTVIGFVCSKCDTRYEHAIVQVTEQERDNPEGAPPKKLPMRCVIQTSSVSSKSAMSFEEGLQLILRNQVEALVRTFKLPKALVSVVGKLWFCFLTSKSIMFHKKRPLSAQIHLKSSEKRRKTEDSKEEDLTVLDANSDVLTDNLTQPCTTTSNCAQNVTIRFDFPKEDKSTFEKSDDDESTDEEQQIEQTIPSLRVLRKKYILDLARHRNILFVTLVILFVSCLFLRLPIFPFDICKWARCGKLPYFSAHRLLPRTMAKRAHLCPLQVPTSSHLEKYSCRFLDQLKLDLAWPPVNIPPILHRMIQELTLFPVIQRTVERLMKEATAHLDYHLHNSPYSLIMAHIVFVLKLLYFFDDQPETSLPMSIPDLPISTLGRLVEWQARRLESAQCEIPWSLEEMEMLSPRELDAFVDFCVEHALAPYDAPGNRRALELHNDLVQMFRAGQHRMGPFSHPARAPLDHNSSITCSGEDGFAEKGQQGHVLELGAEGALEPEKKSPTKKRFARWLLKLCADYLEISASDLYESVRIIEGSIFRLDQDFRAKQAVKYKFF